MKTPDMKKNPVAALAVAAIISAASIFTACNNKPNQIGAGQVITPATDSTGTDNSNNSTNTATDVSGTGSNNGSNNGNSGNGGTNSAPAGQDAPEKK